MPTNVEQAGGIALWNTNQRIDSDDLNHMGTIALQSMTAMLARMLTDEDGTGDPISGFFGDDCVVSVNSGLTLDVGAGIGFLYDESETDVFETVYKPIVVPEADQVTLDAHDSNPRIDVISLAPATDDDQSDSRQIWDSGSSSFNATAVDTRRRLYYTLTVTKGTPAGSPSAPSTPSGHVKIAEAAVPATSGAVVLTDSRSVLTFARSVATVGTSKIEDDAVTEDKVADGSITVAKMAAAARPSLATLSLASGGGGSPAVFDIQVRDAGGNAVSRQVQLVCEVRDGDFDLSVSAGGCTIAETGAGSELTTTASNPLLIQTDANGAAQVTVTSFTPAVTRHLLVSALGATGCVGDYASWTT